MSTDIIVAIINGLVTILVGIITARVAYLGSMRGAKLQIEKANADAERVKKEEEELAKKFIKSFLYKEITENIKKISPQQIRSIRERAEDKLSVSTYLKIKPELSFETYNEVRHTLNKINDVLFVAEVLRIYKCFKILKDNDKLNDKGVVVAGEIYDALQHWIKKLHIEEHLE
ncbi:hypothetical protein BAMY_13815 [Bacillus amyloliquefaciens]|uniref:DUF4760 domain-containing protein n=1 Tax=Bacillus velezensis TaxID=492670 RepID=A0A6A8LHG0_BACVE|nr:MULTISPECIES: hypothetical protein [Bacillus]ALV02362.1 hypothetical protein AVM03_08145 [Bacillus amyloliquefaciens]AOO62599.1 hypothetical protein BBJ33_13960 [Bacillus velezensis]APB83222.1 hypothetical protein BAMY_13815 [Bacillus amyloliquefaciens]AUJ59856.1 hypothetical protein B6257_04160 [Bacillus velezensis]AVX16406.1 hypothetical protein C5I45_05775 [Bacillus sp. ZY-1-1]